MIYKPCPPPKDGGSAKGAVRYILGYQLSTKREDWEARNAAYHSLIAESLERPDFGVGVAWSPEIGGGIRPSSVLALNVGMLATADIEMQALFQGNRRVKVATHHEVFSFGADIGLSDADALEAVRRVYERVGLGKAAMVMAVHRDSFDDKPGHDGHLLLHVHVARSGINPDTLRAFNHQMINTRIARAERAVEMEMGLVIERHDLAIVDHAATTGELFIRDSTVPERIAWSRELREERLIALERGRYADNATREGSFDRYCEARVEPRLRDVIDHARDAGYRPQAIDITNAAARLGTVIQVGDDGRLQLRDVSTARLREEQKAEIEQVRADTAEWKSLARDEHLEMLHVKHQAALAAETRRLLTEGAVAPLTAQTMDALRPALRDPLVLADEIACERAFVAAVDKDPALVARALTEHSSTFSRADVGRYLVDRIVDVGEVERLATRIFDHDTSLVLMSADVADGVWTTKDMLAIEEQVAVDARALAQQPDGKFDANRRARAMAEMEADRSADKLTKLAETADRWQSMAPQSIANEPPFELSDEQQNALSQHGGLVVILGRSGSGKTTLLEAMRRDADEAGRPIRGVTLAQAAALRLEVEAGFGCVNTAYALLADGPRRDLIPRNGILVIDEAGMVDSRTMLAILRTARDRNTIVVAVGDPRQIQAIGAGGSWRILEAVAREAGTFAELTENRRQKHDWHQRAVALTSHAIEREDAPMFARAVGLLTENGALTFTANKDDAIAEIVAWYEAERLKSDDVLLVAADRDTVRYLNEEMIRRRVDRPYEKRYLTDNGSRGLAVGDRFIFGENDTKLGVVNGDTGTVVHCGKHMIEVRLDRLATSNHVEKPDLADSGYNITNFCQVEFDSRKYLSWDHGWSTTISRAQGASVRALGGIVDGAATAEAFHVLIGRSKQELKAVVPETAFPDAAALSEHLAEHIVAKGTTQDISREVAQRGGPDTDYARNVAAQAMSAANPMRQEWEREWTEMRNRRDIETRDLAKRYRAKFKNATDPAEKKRLRLAQRGTEAKIVEAHQPEDFGAWLHRRTEEEREMQIIMRREQNLERQTRSFYDEFVAAQKRTDDEQIQKLETAWQKVYRDRFGIEPVITAVEAPDMGLQLYDDLLDSARREAFPTPLDTAWREQYRKFMGEDPPCPADQAHLLDMQTQRNLLNRARKAVGLPPESREIPALNVATDVEFDRYVAIDQPQQSRGIWR